MMTKQRKYPSKPKRGGEQWALKVLIAVAVPAIAAGFFLLRSGMDVTRGSKEATKGAVIRQEMRPTLSAARFVGKVARAHEIVQEIPEVLDHLYCYCDKHLGYTSLLSCYTGGHAGACDICIEEALEASRLHQQGKGIREIRAELDRQFGRL